MEFCGKKLHIDKNNKKITKKYQKILNYLCGRSNIKTAIKYNNGIINLLGHKEEVNNLYRKGLIEISNDKLEVLVVSDLILKLLSPKVLDNRNILLSYNKDIYNNKKQNNNNNNNIIKNTINNIKNIFNCNNTNNTNYTEEDIELGSDLGINNTNITNNNYKTNNPINSLFDGNEDEYLLEENRPNSIFKIFDNISVCFCCLL